MSNRANPLQVRSRSNRSPALERSRHQRISPLSPPSTVPEAAPVPADSENNEKSAAAVDSAVEGDTTAKVEADEKPAAGDGQGRDEKRRTGSASFHRAPHSCKPIPSPQSQSSSGSAGSENRQRKQWKIARLERQPRSEARSPSTI